MASISMLWVLVILCVSYSLPMVAALGDTISWINPKAAIIGDVILIQGGQRFTNESGTPQLMDVTDTNYLYNISLNCSFPTQGSGAKTIDTLLQSIAQGRVYDPVIWQGGGLFWNDYEFYTFGGVPGNRQGSISTNESVLQGTLYPPAGGGAFDPDNTNVGQWTPALGSPAERSRVTVSTNIAYGAWTSAPKEYSAWWFGGLQAPNGGLINLLPAPGVSQFPNKTSSTFFTVNLKDPGNAIFQNQNLPSYVQPSAEGALVWLPYGKEGILLAFGGAKMPADIQLSGTPNNETNNFMTNINVYDVASGQWSTQSTLETGQAPKQLAQFCTSVAVAQDRSGYFIYVYGGYDGSYTTVPPVAQSRDEVWVLSVPAFQWTLINPGNDDHRRQNHICVSPNPSQMISIGGMTEYQGSLVSGSMIEVYDFNSNEWTGLYNASSVQGYNVPSTIVQQLKTGTSTGGFTVPSNNLNSTISSLLSTQGAAPFAYPIRTCGKQSTGPDDDQPPTPEPSWKKPVEIAVPLTVGLAIIAAMVFFYIRKKRKNGDAESRTATRERKVMSWIGKASPDPLPAASNSSGEDTAVDAEALGYFGRPAPKTVQTDIYEAPSNLASPLSVNDSGHGTPYNVVTMSPALSGSHEVHAAHTYEMDGQSTMNSESMSPRNHPLYPRSLAGTHINSTSAGSVSHPSEGLRPNQYLGHISPYELPHDKSNENLSQPPNDFALNASGLYTGQSRNKEGIVEVAEVRSPASVSPSTPINRKPVNVSSQTHHRQSSSMSSRTYNLPSPGPEEDQRRSTFLDSLPDGEGRSSPGYPQRQSGRSPAGPMRSAYQENFDGFDRH